MPAGGGGGKSAPASGRRPAKNLRGGTNAGGGKLDFGAALRAA